MSNQEADLATSVEEEVDISNNDHNMASVPVEQQLNLEDTIRDNDDVNDPFLNLLCFDNDDGDEVDLNSIEDWSGSEQDYEKDVEDEDCEDVDVVYPCYVPNPDWKLAKPIVSMKFESPAQLKDMLIDYGVANGHQLVFTVNDHNRLLVRCGTKEDEDDGNEGKKKVWKCPFRLWASRIKEDDSFQIKTLNDKHTCSRKFYLGSLVTYTWIAKRFFKKIIQNPETSYREIQEDILKKYQCKVSPGQCGRAKEKVLNDYEGGLKDHYARLSDYQAEILETNPGSTVKMAVETMPNGEVYFSSYYICFKAVKDGWIMGCRKVICLDGCFLKNHDDIEIEGGHGLTLISDQHKGIIEAVKDAFSNAEHRQCTRHIYANFIKKFRGLQSKNLFWAAAKSTSKQWFDRHMEELKISSKGAYDHLMERNPITWSKAFFEVGRACDAFENGMSESFNSRIRTARRKPIISMLEDIRRFVMRRMFFMAKKSERFEHEVCLIIRRKLEDIKKKQRHYQVIPSGNDIFEVRSEKNAYVVKIQEQTCTCRSWQL
ncbi:uncharacterized protein LOC143568114 [Bidens hawaiensis]|uniref:uncharacterized protein LOC143568114 n=1 Tax=Bidens hawaiensis TaxID=980011 RepID=UPI0040497D4E